MILGADEPDRYTPRHAANNRSCRSSLLIRDLTSVPELESMHVLLLEPCDETVVDHLNFIWQAAIEIVFLSYVMPPTHERSEIRTAFDLSWAWRKAR